MFIRKRNGRYQAVNSYRVEGKVKQHVLSLGRHASVEEAIKWQKIMLECSIKELARPVTEYTEIKLKRVLGLCKLAVPVKVAQKRRAKVLERYEKQKKKLEQLENIEKVLHLKKIDTTNADEDVYF